MVLIKSTGTNLEYIQILYMVSVYISINILTSNITYGNIPKNNYICKEITHHSKKRFFAHGNGKVQVPLQYFALRISAFFALAEQRLCV